MATRFESAVKVFRSKHGILRMSEAVRAGISRKTLYGMLDAGVVEGLSRGVYRLTALPSLASPDLVTEAVRIPNGVICLLSALAYHELTRQIPHAVDVAIEQELLLYCGLERFLFRLSRSVHRERFILKGALMLREVGPSIPPPFTSNASRHRFSACTRFGVCLDASIRAH